MVYKKYKIVAWVLAVLMSAAFFVSAFIPMKKPQNSLQAEAADEFGLVEDNSLSAADTSSRFDDGVVRVNEELQGERWMIVQLKGESLSQSSSGNLNEFSESKKGRKTEKRIKQQQAKLLSDLRTAGISFEYKYGYTMLTNAVAIRTDVKNAKKIGKMENVLSVDVSERYYAPKDSAVTNDANVWGTGIYKVDEDIAANYNGKGMVVAVLDTGLDASHRAFLTNPTDKSALITKQDVNERVFDGVAAGVQAKNSSVTVDDVYYNEKVPFAYDYADNDADVYPSYSSHGTHVAGIIAGTPIYDENGEQETIKDQDGNEILDKDGKPMTFTGVAPQAQLAIFKVFTDRETSEQLGGAETMDILAALEDCVKLGVDVINMSLGSSAGFSSGDDAYMESVYESVRAAGISLVVAASNDSSSNYGGAYGTNLSSNPDSATVGSPSTYPGALSVASIDGQQAKYIRVNVGGNDKFLYYSEASDGNGNKKDFIAELRSNLGQPSGEIALDYVVVPGYGQAVNYTRNINVRGKIAVVRRGGNVTFEEKVRVAKQKGAVACVIYNNVSGIIHMSLGNLNNPIPTCSITMDAANGFVRSGKGKMFISESQKAGPFMSDFSSWGPTPDLQLKPEISAHGGEITSAVANGWAEYSGTSMASPNMAGAMSLILSYVKQNVAYEEGNAKRDAVATSNFIVMSTATIARDQSDIPYSPRKQGAGLADIRKAMTTKAYLYSDKCDKAKVEVGDDPLRQGNYTLKFKIKNISSQPRTYTLGTQTMTETIATDGMTVAERGYLLDGFSDISFSGTGVSGNTLTLGANADVEITVDIRLGAKAKEYIESNFKNGMYVEGFVTLKDTSSDTPVDLNLPWLGFYGDWYAAPMFDISEYELSEALQDDSIPDDEKPKAAVFPTVPLGSYNDDKYIIPLGSYLYDQKEGTRKIYSSSDKAAISIYDEVGHRTVSQLYAIYAGLLRGAEYMNISITDAVTGEKVFEKVQKNVRKAYTGGSATARAAFVELEWDAKKLGLENNRQYLFHMDGKLASMQSRPYDPDLYEYGKSFDFNFYIDTEAPEIVDYRVRYEPYKDANDKLRYSVFLDVDVYDNHYAQSIALCFADYSTMTLELLDAEMTPIYSERDSVTTVSLDITDYYDKDVDIYLQVDDYALNARAYRVKNFKALADSVDYPESIKITSGTDKEGDGYSKAITIGVNEALKLETSVMPANSASVNLFWQSFDESVVKVKDGELFGVGTGSALVRVYGGKNEYAQASDGIWVTVSEEVHSQPSITGLKMDLISDSHDSLVNPTNSQVSVHPNKTIRLHVTAEPWYSSIKPEMVWTSSVPEVASVGEKTGVVKTLREGIAVITGTMWLNGNPTLYTVSTTLSVGPEFVVQNGFLREYHGAGGKVAIPKSLNVYYIYEEAFLNNNNITELEISAPCTEIQINAFANMKMLERVVIPDTVEFVYRYAFRGCKKLKQIDLHSRAISFGEGCFEGCESLQGINNVQLLNGLKKEDVEILKLKENVDYKRISAHMTSIGERAFAGCNGLKTLDITELRVAGRGAFYDCRGLEKVVLSRFTAIADDMFLNCVNLNELQYVDLSPEQIETITYTGKEAPFGNCNITKITFGAESSASFVSEETNGVFALYAEPEKKTLLKVGQNAVSFSVPASVERIAANAFSGNSRLTNVSFAEGGALKEIGEYAFSGTALNEIRIPASVEKIGKGAFSWCEKLSWADLSQFNGKLPARAFYHAGVQTLSIGGGVTEIGSECFAYTQLKDLDLTGTSVSQLNDGAFANCTLLVNVKLSGITGMGKGVFAADNGVLASVSFAQGSTALGEYAFAGQSKLQTFECGAELSAIAEIPAGVFSGCSSLVSLPFAPNVVGDYAFNGCAVLKDINVSELQVVGDSAFKNCVEFGGDFSALEKIGAQAFYGCKKIEALNLPSVKTIGNRAFALSGLRSVSFPLLQEVGGYAFSNTALSTSDGKFVIPQSVTKIGEGAFSGLTFINEFVIEQNQKYFTENGVLYERVASGVQAIACPAGKIGEIALNDSTVRVGASAFAYASRLTKISFPYSFKSVGDAAFYACGATEYVFNCLKAPVLETQAHEAEDFPVDSDMYKILNTMGSVASEKYYSNFKDYVALVLFAGKDGIKGIPDLHLTLVCPENASGFNGRLYAAYFSTRKTSAVIADDYAREALARIEKLPTAEQVRALTASDAEVWKEYRALASSARTAYNLVSQRQSEFVTNSARLYEVEKAMREKAPVFGEAVTQERILVGVTPNKMDYLRGEKFDASGLVLILIWSDGSREEIREGITVLNQDEPLTLDNRTVRIQYGKLVTQLNVNVSKPAVASIAVKVKPDDSHYIAGDTYLGAGIVLEVVYVDGISEEISLGYEVNGGKPIILKDGENVIEVSYGGKTTSYMVIVGEQNSEPENPVQPEKTGCGAVVSVAAILPASALLVLAVYVVTKKRCER